VILMSFYRSSPMYSPFFPRLSFSTPINRMLDDPFFNTALPSSFYSIYEDPTPSDISTKMQQRIGPSDSSSDKSLTTSSFPRSSGDDAAVQGRGDTKMGNRHHHHHHHHPLSFFSPMLSNVAPMPDMTVDMFSTPTEYIVHASVPGIDKRDINVTIEDGNVLRIEAERREERREKMPSTSRMTGAGSQRMDPASQKMGTGPQKMDTASQKMESGGQRMEAGRQESKEESKQQKPEQRQDTSMQMEPSEEKGGEDDFRYHHVESYYGHVERRLQLPDDVNLEGLSARYEDGVLKIALPRLPEKKQQGRKVEVQ